MSVKKQWVGLSKTFLLTILTVISILFLMACGADHPTENIGQEPTESVSDQLSDEDPTSDSGAGEDGQGDESEPDRTDAKDEDDIVEIRLTAVGDAMGHIGQIRGAYESENDTYNFKPVFQHVKPIIEQADIALANFETTLAGEEYGYSGYPLFNSPDSYVKDLVDTGFEGLVTVNNHSLDTGFAGLERTFDIINENGAVPIGTFKETPKSRVTYQEVEGVTIAIIAYTSFVNVGPDGEYSSEDMQNMLNLLDEDQLIVDIHEAKDQADIVLGFMHWGNEYIEVLSGAQTLYTEVMAREGVDLVIGSHPHVVQRAEWIERDEYEDMFVAYSLGNFVSNQSRETLGPENSGTQYGVILNVDLQKDLAKDETTISNVEFIPTYVHRELAVGGDTYDFAVLPIKSSLNNEDLDLSEETRTRMEAAYEDVIRRLSVTDQEAAVE